MSDRDGILVRSRKISDLNQSIGVNFQDLFKAVGKGVADGAFGHWDRVAKDAVDAVGALKGQPGIEYLVWLLVYRSINRAIRNLVNDNHNLFKSDYKNYDSIAGKVKYALEDIEITIDQGFFNHPQELLKVLDIQTPLAQWVQHYGLNQAQAIAIAQRFPSYFLHALRQEWHDKASEYNQIIQYFNTPFSAQIVKEESWLRYAAWLQIQVDQPMFLEAFSLRQVYVKPRAYYKKKIEHDDYQDNFRNRRKFQGKKIAVDLFTQIKSWMVQSDQYDALRIISGDPGSGKSSFSRMLAAELSKSRVVQSGKLRVLFIPLHRLNIKDDLVSAVGKFISHDEYLAHNPLDPEQKESRILIIFDGLDELSMQGKLGVEAAKSFIKEVQNLIRDFNYQATRLQVIISGRPVVIDSNQDELRKSEQILQILPYLIPENKRDEFEDKSNLLTEDRRNLWWQKYGQVTGNNYDKMPDELNLNSLLEITTQPLLNYLVALSYIRSKDPDINTENKIVFSENTNLNAIYQDLLKSVYDRGWDTNQHPTLQGVKYPQFVRILEEIALAAWHGNGRTTTVKEITDYCEGSGLKKLLEIFTKGAESGVTNLLTAFYFRQSGYSNDGDRTFEFTHKSFGEYLTARRIVRELARINKQLQARDDDPDEGWDEKQALTRWIMLCGMSAIDEYLFDFVCDEIALQKKDEVKQWQQTLSHLIGYMLRQGMPMEKLDPRPTYKEECRQGRNAEEALLAVLSACARYTEEISNIEWQSKEYSFGKWLSHLQNQIEDDDKAIVNQYLTWLNLRGADLRGADLRGANLAGAYLTRANLRGADLIGVDLRGADLRGVDLTRANLAGAYLTRADLAGANLAGAYLTRADLAGAYLAGAYLARADLRGADLAGANLAGANLTGADLTGADLTGADLTRADLTRAIMDNELRRDLYSLAHYDV
ncbi:MAG: pentapeptide repeat-containing protein [Cyanobacteria bacterium P01_A01_bin.40]